MLAGKFKVLFWVCSFSLSVVVLAGPKDWTHYGHTASRHSIAVDGPNTIDSGTLSWIAYEDPWDPDYDIVFEGPSSPVVYNNIVYAHAKYFDSNDEYTHNQIIAFDADTGQTLWAALVDIAVFDSWPSPCVDTKHNTILIGSGEKVFALNADTGTQIWAAELEKAIVNASVCTALDIPHARAFITDYMGFGSTGMIYCINLDPNDSNENPYEPGQIVWSDVLGGTSGATCAYKDGVVYVASITDPNGSWSIGNPNPGGTIHAYDATAEPNSVRLWRTTDPNFEGFFGGVVVTKKGFLYAANYDFYGGEDNSALCKIDCNNGSIIWTTQTERTKSVPVVVGDRIYLAGGIDDYGSRPKIEAYGDNGSTVTKLWESPNDIVVGGWTHQPVYANGKLYVGAIPTDGSFGPYTDLYIFDVSLTPDNPNFIIEHYHGCGSSPAVTYDSIFSIGIDGLYKFHQPALLGDVSEDNILDVSDISLFVEAWLFNGPVGVDRADLNLDGLVNMLDFALLVSDWGKGVN